MKSNRRSSGDKSRSSLLPLFGVILVGLMAVIGMTAGCGYHLRGLGSSLPPHIKRLSIPMFRNLTTRYELDLKLTQAVLNAFASRGRVDVVTGSERADAVLDGEISGFTATPIAFTDEAQADRYNITVKARIVLTDRVNRTILFSNPSFIYIQEYEVPPGTDFESIETEAIGKIAEKFAQSLVVAILESF